MILARGGLLDALDALGVHRSSVTLVGAQAVYLHTATFSSTVAEFTVDADLAFHPQFLAASPLIEDCLIEAGYVQGDRSMPGRWISTKAIPVDFMIPEKLVGSSSRSAGVPPHAKYTARSTRGIEGCLVDREFQVIKSLNFNDSRSFKIHVAGPSGLLIAKMIKISERLKENRLLKDKDPYDVYRLLSAVSLDTFFEGLKSLIRNPLSREVTIEGLGQLELLFAKGAEAPGSIRAGAAEEGIGSPEFVSQSVTVLARELLETLPKF